jgi:thioredoxin:protein disulfide reductase
MFNWMWSFAPIAVLLAATAATTVAAQQPARPNLLQVASHVSEERVAVGDRFSVTLDLAPAPRMHVYAPTVVNYKPIVLTVRPQPGLIVRSVAYPPAEKYFYAPLKETVDVYQKPFQVVQELALDGSPAGRAALKGVSTIIVQGTLNYQACDDKICYPPRTVPMTWTVAIKES